MKQMRTFVLLLVVVCCFFAVPMRYAANDEVVQPDVFGKYTVSIDAKTGDVLYDKNANAQWYPASITKVLTAILLMEHTQPGEQIAFSEKALQEEKSNYQIEFQPGETIDRDTALTILMVLSANDVAYAIAEHISGSPEEFAKLMNAKAKELGAKNSHFVTPNGLHHPEHVTTPYDMAMIARGVLNKPEIMTAMITKQTTVTTSRQTVSIFNKATFFENPECIAGKTGFTSQAHNTLVLINQKDGKEIINVVMDSRKPDIYNDMNIISQYAFGQLEKQTVLDQQTWTKQLPILNKAVDTSLERGSELMLQHGESQNVEVNIVPLQFDNEKLYQEGIRTGEVIGQAQVMKNGNVLDTVNIIAKSDVTYEKPTETQAFQLPVEGIALAGLLAVGGITAAVRRGKKQKKVNM